MGSERGEKELTLDFYLTAVPLGGSKCSYINYVGILKVYVHMYVYIETEKYIMYRERYTKFIHLSMQYVYTEIDRYITIQKGI